MIETDDSKTCLGKVPAVLTKAGSADAAAAEPGHLQDARGRTAARACGAVFQAERV